MGISIVESGGPAFADLMPWLYDPPVDAPW
jgi:hypothetical protein